MSSSTRTSAGGMSLPLPCASILLSSHAISSGVVMAFSSTRWVCNHSSQSTPEMPLPSASRLGSRRRSGHVASVSWRCGCLLLGQAAKRLRDGADQRLPRHACLRVRLGRRLWRTLPPHPGPPLPRGTQEPASPKPSVALISSIIAAQTPVSASLATQR